MAKIRLDKIAYEPHPVSASRKRELNSTGYRVVDSRFAPAGHVVATDSDDGLSDDELRAAIEAATGKAPHRNTGRSKLLEQYEALGGGVDQDDEAENGLTRREIEADLTAMEIDFDPADSVNDLAAMRDMAREDRSGA